MAGKAATKHIFAVASAWIIIMIASFVWNHTNAVRNNRRIAFQTARSFFDQLVVQREWNAKHGGVYVPVTNDTQPNPYLDIPLRDIDINEDLKLTKINPAFMTRQISEIATKRQGVHFHITSLKPIRPANRPTPREEMALEAFERGMKEVGEVSKSVANRDGSFFYMAPLKTKEACLGCHAKQGYKKGDIRGGISVTLPFSPRIPILPLAVGHIGIGLAGMLLIVIFGRKLDKAYQEIQRQSLFDSLTLIPNRRSFSERIIQEFKNSQRENHPLSVIIGDIDNFKNYNDLYGHKAGDECLKQAAGAIQDAMKRPSDFCARYGGEEFSIILPNTDSDGALNLAEEIRRNVLSLTIPHGKSSASNVVSISLGVATSNEEVASYEDLMKLADRALYAAKEKGRNRVEVS